jgi:hypothetical protein
MKPLRVRVRETLDTVSLKLEASELSKLSLGWSAGEKRKQMHECEMCKRQKW